MITKKDAQNFINTVKELRDAFTDEQARLNIQYFPSWKPNREYDIGVRVKYNNILYKVIENHLSNEFETPDKAEFYYLAL